MSVEALDCVSWKRQMPTKSATVCVGEHLIRQETQALNAFSDRLYGLERIARSSSICSQGLWIVRQRFGLTALLNDFVEPNARGVSDVWGAELIF